ncbi:MAG TPA: SMC-Scp complex subunit ScpB [Firmicutes bacterium]|nr:SMC-Scp complex subunit ScpB [Bacillota bacterium]
MITIYQSLPALLEALLFVAGAPLTLEEICAATDLAPDDARLALQELQSQYEGEGRGLQLRYVAGGYQLCTKAEYAPYIENLLGKREKNTLSQAALETLAIIAYKQPVTKFEIENIRGVRVDSVLNTLMEKGLVKEMGRKAAPGRPILYGTTRYFLTAFGLKDIQDLPRIDEGKNPDTTKGRA